MTRLKYLILFTGMTLIQSCSWEYYAYILNETEKPVMINVHLKDLNDFKRLPNKVYIAQEIIKFRWGFRSNFLKTHRVVWTDSSHFFIELKPHHTLFLNDMTNGFHNRSSNTRVDISITSDNKTKTIVEDYNPSPDWKFTIVGVTYHIIYYTVK